MRHDQVFRIRGTLNGDRIVTEPLAANDATRRAYEMKAQGYYDITMIDVATGEEINLREWSARPDA